MVFQSSMTTDTNLRSFSDQQNWWWGPQAQHTNNFMFKTYLNIIFFDDGIIRSILIFLTKQFEENPAVKLVSIKRQFFVFIIIGDNVTSLEGSVS